MGLPIKTLSAAAILVFLSLLALARGGYLESMELGAYDWLVRLQPALPAPPARIALVTVSERDIRELGRWPIPDATLARAIEQLAAYGPRAIGLDIFRDVPVPPGREELEAILVKHPFVIATMTFGDGNRPGVPPPSVLRDTARVGFNDILVDRGGIVRRGLLFLDDGETTAYSLALRLALMYLEGEGVTPVPDPSNPEHLRLGLTTIRPLEANDGGYVGVDARGYQFLLDFRDLPQGFPHYSLTALLAGQIARDAFKDKIVLIGVTAESVKDLFYTPYSRRLEAEQEVPGIVLHAVMTNQLLRAALEGHAALNSPKEWQELGWALVWVAAGSLLGLWSRSPARFALILGGGLLLLGSTAYIAFAWSWWIPLITPALAWVLSASLATAYMVNQEERQRALLMTLFGRHVSPEIAREIWRDRDQFFSAGRPHPQKLIATVMFTDVQGFTALAERLEPQVLLDWLNQYLEAIAPLVPAHGGVVFRFLGDAIMAVFGAPVPHRSEAEIRQDAVNAVACALAMERRLAELNRHWQEHGLPIIGMRIGINTGPVVAGSVGDRERLEYNVHGDTVNTAARLEGVDKDHFVPEYLGRPCRILIGESTLGHLDERFETEPAGQVYLRGKQHPLVIFRVRGWCGVETRGGRSLAL